jgi:hypothetical protein
VAGSNVTLVIIRSGSTGTAVGVGVGVGVGAAVLLPHAMAVLNKIAITNTRIYFPLFMIHLPQYIYPLRVITLIKGYCDIIPRLASPDTIEGWLDSIIQPPAIPLERGKQHPNPLYPPYVGLSMIGAIWKYFFLSPSL